VRQGTAASQASGPGSVECVGIQSKPGGLYMSLPLGAVIAVVCSCRVEVGPADANEDVKHMLRQQLHLPIVPALSELGFGSSQ
jgi:hypothetical protein